jgi:hypothetical protein
VTPDHLEPGERRSTRRLHPACDWLDPTGFAHTGYVSIGTVLAVNGFENVDAIIAELHRLGFVHRVDFPMRVWSKGAGRNISQGNWQTVSSIYRGEAVGRAANRLSGYTGAWTSVGDLTGWNTSFVFKDAELAVLFRMMLEE